MCWHGLVLRTTHNPHAVCQEVCKEEANAPLLWLDSCWYGCTGWRRRRWACRETYRVLAAPAYLGLLSIIVARHPLMHAEVDTLLLASA